MTCRSSSLKYGARTDLMTAENLVLCIWNALVSSFVMSGNSSTALTDVWQATSVAMQSSRRFWSSQKLMLFKLALLTINGLIVGRHRILCFLVSAWSFKSFKWALISVSKNLQ